MINKLCKLFANLDTRHRNQATRRKMSVTTQIEWHTDGKGMITVNTPKNERACSRTLLMLDTSYSMNTEAVVKNDDGDKVKLGWSLLDIVKHAAQTIVHAMEEDSMVSIWTFSEGARQIAGWTSCNELGKIDVVSKIMGMQPESATNFRDAILSSFRCMQELRNNQDMTYNIVIMTDGQPSSQFHPPRGLGGYKIMVEAEKKAIVEKTGINPCVTMIGIGGNLDSEVLMSSGDMFLHVPDAGSIGSFMVNLATLFKTSYKSSHGVADACLLVWPFPPNARVIGRDFTVHNNVATVSLGHIQVDRSFHVVFEGVNTESLDTELQIQGNPVSTCHSFKNCQWRAEQVNGPNGEDFKSCMFRAQLSDLLAKQPEDAICLSDTNKITSFATLVKNLMSVHSGYDPTLEYTIQTEILVGWTPENWRAWGRHYTRSLRGSIHKEFMSNFRDKCLARYGLGADGKEGVASKICNGIEETFFKLKAPTPSLLSSNGGASTRGWSTGAPPVAQQLPDEFMRGGGCLHGSCTVYKFAESGISAIPISNVKPNDYIQTQNGFSKVQCLTFFESHDGIFTLTTLPSGEKLTPWHPVMVGDDWVHACNVSGSKTSPEECSVVYDIVFYNDHMNIVTSGVQCASLGHNIKGEVIGHPFWGKAIRNVLKNLPGWSSGIVNMTNYSQHASNDTFDVNLNELEPMICA